MAKVCGEAVLLREARTKSSMYHYEKPGARGTRSGEEAKRAGPGLQAWPLHRRRERDRVSLRGSGAAACPLGRRRPSSRSSAPLPSPASRDTTLLQHVIITILYSSIPSCTLFKYTWICWYDLLITCFIIVVAYIRGILNTTTSNQEGVRGNGLYGAMHFIMWCLCATKTVSSYCSDCWL